MCKNFDPALLQKMYEEYTSSNKNNEIIKDLSNCDFIEKECPFLVPVSAGKCSVPIRGTITYVVNIKNNGAELTFVSEDNFARVTISCKCTSYKKSSDVKDGYEKEQWELRIMTKFSVNSSEEKWTENVQFKKLAPETVNEIWQNGFVFTSAIVSDFDSGYLNE